MRRLAFKITILALPFALVLAYTEYKLRRLPNIYSITRAAVEERIGEVEVLILGSSHARSAVSPQFLDCPAFNLANGSQSLHYDTQLVAKYVGAAPRLKLVVFTISYHSLESRLLNSIERWRAGFYRQVFAIPSEGGDAGFQLTDYSYIALYTPKEAYRRVFGLSRRSGGANAAAAGGGANAEGGAGVSEEFARNRIELHEAQMRRSDLPANVEALERACAMLRDRGISVVFITVPTHRTYYERMRPATYQVMQETIRQIGEKYQVPYFNYMFDRRFSDEDFINSDHLNPRGAEKFSKIINEDIVKKYVAGCRK